MNVLYQALAAKRFGGRVIVQARRQVAAGQIPPRLVAVPGILVDAVVINPAEEREDSTGTMSFLLPAHRIPRPPSRVLTSPQRKVWRRWLTEGDGRRVVPRGASGHGRRGDRPARLPVPRTGRGRQRRCRAAAAGHATGRHRGGHRGRRAAVDRDRGARRTLQRRRLPRQHGGVPRHAGHLQPVRRRAHRQRLLLDARVRRRRQRQPPALRHHVGRPRRVDGHRRGRRRRRVLRHAARRRPAGHRPRTAGSSIDAARVTRRAPSATSRACASTATACAGRARRCTTSPSAPSSASTDDGVELCEVAPGIDVDRDVLGQMSFIPKLASDAADDGRAHLPPGPDGPAPGLGPRPSADPAEQRPADQPAAAPRRRRCGCRRDRAA